MGEEESKELEPEECELKKSMHPEVMSILQNKKLLLLKELLDRFGHVEAGRGKRKRKGSGEDREEEIITMMAPRHLVMWITFLMKYPPRTSLRSCHSHEGTTWFGRGGFG